MIELKDKRSIIIQNDGLSLLRCPSFCIHKIIHETFKICIVSNSMKHNKKTKNKNKERNFVKKFTKRK